MRLRSRLFIAVICCLLAGPGNGCSKSSLQQVELPGPPPLDNRIRIDGQFCTDHPDSLRFPVNVLIIVDCSLSMDVTDPADPQSRRVTAVLELIDRIRDAKADVSVALMRFDGAANVLTQVDDDGDGVLDRDGFTQDSGKLQVAASQLIQAAATTDYDAALALAFTLLDTDMRRNDAVTLARSRYVIIFLSDGMPDPVNVGNGHNTPEDIVERVDQLRALAPAFALGDLRLNTVYLATGQPDHVQQPAIDLLTSMSRHGGGTFRNFDNGEAIHFLRFDLTSLKRIFSMKTLVVFNHSARMSGLSVWADTDGDGLPDDEERLIGSDPLRPDTDGDGFSDFLEYKLRFSGYDPLAGNDANCGLQADRSDSDGDGLRDCEERFLGTNPQVFDSDADGYPDPVEALAGTNPALADAGEDLDEDGTPNGEEIIGHSDPADPDAAFRARESARYLIEHLGQQDDGRQCYAFSVENLTLAATAAPDPLEPATAGWNDIRLYVGQTPFDHPQEPGTFRVACVRARYDALANLTEPLTGQVTLEVDDFHDPLDFDPQSHCRGAQP